MTKVGSKVLPLCPLCLMCLFKEEKRQPLAAPARDASERGLTEHWLPLRKGREWGMKVWGDLCLSRSPEESWKGCLGLGSNDEELLHLQMEDVLQSRVVGGVGTSEPLPSYQNAGLLLS